MGTYAVTGSVSGMGQQVAEKLRAAGNSVIGVDIKDSDVVADLSTERGRRTAADSVLAACGGTLDGAVLAAGLGPIPGRERLIAGRLLWGGRATQDGTILAERTFFTGRHR